MESQDERDYRLYIEKMVLPEIRRQNVSEYFDEDEILPISGRGEGFWARLYSVNLSQSKKIKPLSGCRRGLFLFAKLMKRGEPFRDSNRLCPQFSNEVYLYTKLLPRFGFILIAASDRINFVEDWVANCVVAHYGYLRTLSSSEFEPLSVVVIENIRNYNYIEYPGLYLDNDHLCAMADLIGKYHAVTYVLRIHEYSQFEAARKAILTVRFYDPPNTTACEYNYYRVVYRIAFDRFFAYFDRVKYMYEISDRYEDKRLLENIQRLKAHYFEEPTKLLVNLCRKFELINEELHFITFIHGNYNHKHVLFYYDRQRGGNSRRIKNTKMINLHEIRYASPAFDLSFFMYLNIDETLRERYWFNILSRYHRSMAYYMTSLLNQLRGSRGRSEVLAIVTKFCERDFLIHFNRYAFYGAMACMYYLPWCIASREDCHTLNVLFETRLQSEEFRNLLLTVGGDTANEKILRIIKHASNMGYMDNLWN